MTSYGPNGGVHSAPTAPGQGGASEYDFRSDFPWLRFDSNDEPCPTLTAHHLLDRFPEADFGSPPPVALVQAALDVAYGMAPFSQGGQDLEYEYLFRLARRLRSLVPTELRGHPETADRLSPYALVFSDAVVWSYNEPDSTRFGWDEEDVRMGFAVDYGKVRFAEGEDVLGASVALALAKPLVLDPTPRHSPVGKLLSMAHYLQEIVGDDDILLPVQGVNRAWGYSGHDWATKAIVLALEYRTSSGAALLRCVDASFRPGGNGRKGRAKRFRFDRTAAPQ